MLLGPAVEPATGATRVVFVVRVGVAPSPSPGDAPHADDARPNGQRARVRLGCGCVTPRGAGVRAPSSAAIGRASARPTPDTYVPVALDAPPKVHGVADGPSIAMAVQVVRGRGAPPGRPRRLRHPATAVLNRPPIGSAARPRVAARGRRVARPVLPVATPGVGVAVAIGRRHGRPRPVPAVQGAGEPARAPTGDARLVALNGRSDALVVQTGRPATVSVMAKEALREPRAAPSRPPRPPVAVRDDTVGYPQVPVRPAGATLPRRARAIAVPPVATTRGRPVAPAVVDMAA